MRVERVESSLKPLTFGLSACCIRAILLSGVGAAMTSVAFAAASSEKGLGLADGVIVTMPNGCEIWSADAPFWRALEMQKPSVRPDQRIRCSTPGTLRLRLPGNGALEEIEFKSSSFEYLVPFGVDNPSLPAAKTPGRDAALDSQRVPSIIPMPVSKTAKAGLAPSTKDAPRLAMLETCDQPLGTLAIVEPEGDTQANLQRYGLGSPSAVVRLLAQQSNCFNVVGRHVAAGELTREVGKSQMVAADYLVNPSVRFSEPGIGGIGGLFGNGLGAVGGSIKFKRPNTTMALFDVRSGIQLAVVVGDGRKTSSDEVNALFANTDGSFEGYKSTTEGKLVAASFASNWNDLIRTIKDESSQIGKAPATGPQDAASAATRLQEVKAGDTLVATVDGVQVLAEPSDRATTIRVLTQSDRVVATGEQRNGFIKITVATGTGWVKAILMDRP